MYGLGILNPVGLGFRVEKHLAFAFNKLCCKSCRRGERAGTPYRPLWKDPSLWRALGVWGLRFRVDSPS